MPLRPPNLDDIDFDRLIDEARARIPDLAPEWTDHNYHDPGMTLLELVAWIVDQQMYQVGHVGTRHREAFAALLGVHRKRAAPARGLIWPDDSSSLGYFGALPAGHRVVCVEQPNLHFELEYGIVRSSAKPSASAAGATQFNAADRTFRAARCVGGDSSPGYIEFDFDSPLLETALPENHSVSIGLELANASPGCSGLTVETGTLVADYRVGDDSAPWWRLLISNDGTRGLTRSGAVLFVIPPEAMVNARGKRSALRLRVLNRLSPLPAKILAPALNVLPIVQFETIQGGPIGKSNGKPDQTLYVRLDGISDEPFRGENPKNFGIETIGAKNLFWTETDDLKQCGPTDQAFELHRASNTVVFGNGVNGLIPPKDAAIRHTQYRLTAGARGNVSAGLRWNVFNLTYRNPAPFTCGADEWTDDQLHTRARARAVNRTALVTDEDLKSAVQNEPEFAVENVFVMRQAYPALGSGRAPGSRTIVVTPKRADEMDALQPVPRRYIDMIDTALRPRRVLGERLAVVASSRKPIRVFAEVLIGDGMAGANIVELICATINARLTDVQSKEHPDTKPWPAGRPVTVSEIKQLIAKVAEVTAVAKCQMADGDGRFGDADIYLAAHEIAIGQNHEVKLRYLRDRFR